MKDTPSASGNKIIQKARLVARELQQWQGVHYIKIVCSSSYVTSIRSLKHLIAHFDLEFHATDVDMALLNGQLEKQIYMKVLDCVERSNRKSTLCNIVKPLYGLKLAPWQWNFKIDRFLESIGFSCSTGDPWFYMRQFEGQDLTIILLYIDNLLIAGKAVYN